jgi:hypothetical protein
MMNMKLSLKEAGVYFTTGPPRSIDKSFPKLYAGNLVVGEKIHEIGIDPQTKRYDYIL